MEEQILLDKEGYEKLKKEIEDLKRDLCEINKGRNLAFDAGSGDGWDTPEFEYIERMEGQLISEINDKLRMLSNSKIIEKNISNNIIGINSVVNLLISQGNERCEEVVKLISGVGMDTSDYLEVSINSPIGKAIFNKKIGEVSFCKIGEKDYKIKILNILK